MKFHSCLIFLIVLTIPLVISFTQPALVLASYADAYRTYNSNFQTYRETYSGYQTAKSSYLTYRTLESQNDALEKMRQVLRARNQLLSSYYDLLQEKMNETPGITEIDKKTFANIRLSEQNWLTGNQTKIDAASSLNDLNKVGEEFRSRYSQISIETSQALGTILMAKELVLSTEVKNLTASFSAKITDLRLLGENTSFWDRGVLSAKSKLDLYDLKFTEARNVFYPSRINREIKTFEGQQRLTEANQYLREALSFLREILNSIVS